MSRTSTGVLQDLLERHVADGTAPGIVASLGTAAETRTAAAGLMVVGGVPMRDDAIFRIQSMTKAFTCVAALRLVEAGRLTLDEPVERWLPELADRRVLRSPTGDLADTSAAVPRYSFAGRTRRRDGNGERVDEGDVVDGASAREVLGQDSGGTGYAGGFDDQRVPERDRATLVQP